MTNHAHRDAPSHSYEPPSRLRSHVSRPCLFGLAISVLMTAISVLSLLPKTVGASAVADYHFELTLSSSDLAAMPYSRSGGILVATSSDTSLVTVADVTITSMVHTTNPLDIDYSWSGPWTVGVISTLSEAEVQTAFSLHASFATTVPAPTASVTTTMNPTAGEKSASEFPPTSNDVFYDNWVADQEQRHFHVLTSTDERLPTEVADGLPAPIDSRFLPEWDLDLPQAWAITRGDPSVVVAIVDGGIDDSLDDLAGQVLDLDPPGAVVNVGGPGAPDDLRPGEALKDDDGDGFIDEDRWGILPADTGEFGTPANPENVLATATIGSGFVLTMNSTQSWAANELSGWDLRTTRFVDDIYNPSGYYSRDKISSHPASVAELDGTYTTTITTATVIGSTVIGWEVLVAIGVVALIADGIDSDDDGVDDDLGYDPSARYDDDENGFIDDRGLRVTQADPNLDSTDYLDPVYHHGTGIAGLVAARWDAGEMVGIAPGIRIVPIQWIEVTDATCSTQPTFTLDSSGAGLLRGPEYAEAKGARIVSSSIRAQFQPPFTSLNQKILEFSEDVTSRGMIHTNGVGNASSFAPHSMAPNVSDLLVLVAGTQDGNVPWVGTNYHESVNIGAPATVHSLDPCDVSKQGFSNWDGTSESGPIVAGVAALMMSAYPHWSNEFVVAKLLGSTVPYDVRPGEIDPGAAPYVGRLGGGVVNAYRALTYYDELFPFYEVAEPATHVVNWQDSVYLSGDLHIPAGQELVVAAGSVIEVGQDDIMETGNITRQIEIRVDGTLTINGTAQNPVVFRMFGDDGLPAGEPAHNPDQTWGGFLLLTSESIAGEHFVLEDLAPRSTVVAVPEVILAPGQIQPLVWVGGTPDHLATRIRTSVDGGASFDVGSMTPMTLFNWTATQDMVNKDVVIRVEFLDADLYVTAYEDINTVRVREPFANVSVESNMTIPQGSTPYASAPLDYDEDGLEDFVISYEGDRAQLYKNAYDLVTDIGFLSRSSELGSGLEENTRGVNRIDVNNDGHIDVFLAANGTTIDSKLFLGDGIDLNAAADPTTLAAVDVKAVKSAAWGDFNKDGWLDAYLVRDGAATDILMQAVPGSPVTYTDVTSAAGLFTSGTNQTSAAMWVDADLDKDQDLFVCWEGTVSAGPALGWSPFYFNQGPDGAGQYTFVDESKETGAGPTGVGIGRLGELVGVDFADLNSDRKLDILLAANAGPSAPFGNLIVCLNNGYGGMTTEGGSIGIYVSENIVDVEVADLDGNGVPDIIAVPEAATTVRVLVGFGDRSNRNYVDASGAYQLGSDLAYGVTTTDIDADSDHDILVLRPESGVSQSDKKFLWANPLLDAPASAGQEKTLTVGFDPASLTHNPFGIGSIVAVEVTPPGGSTLYSSQVVDGGSGRGGQGAGRLAFGLAGASTAQITVRWPHGGVQVFDASAMPGFPDVLIADTTDPVIDEPSITWSYVPTSGTTIHTFQWWTDGPSDEAQVLVNISSPNDSSCRIPLGGDTTELLDGDNPGVGATSVKIGERYRHTVTWSTYCSDGCNYTYKVRNVIGGQVYTASQKTMKVMVCADIIQM